jgi:hypothetical protein
LSNHEQDNESAPFHEEGGAVIFDRPKSQEEIARQRREDEQHEFARAQVGTNKKLAWFTGLLVIGTFCGTAIGIWQATISQKASNAAKSAASTADATLKELQKNEASSGQQFQTQLGKLDESTKQSSRLADATEKANANVLEADRPWMSAWVQVADFEAGKKPVYTFTFVNTGKRPAKTTLTANRENSYLGFPSDPDKQYIFDTAPSTNFVVPGQPVISTLTADKELTQQELDFYAAQSRVEFFAFAKVEYTDVRTNAKYWTHVCLRYLPKFRSLGNEGFRNCAEYSDAK